MSTETSARDARDPKAVELVVRALAAQFGNRLVTSAAVREQHANTTTWVANEPPDAVVFPQTTADVQQIVRICAAHRVPVIAFGTGTSLEGQINAPHGGVCIDVRDMNRVLAVHAEDLDCVIEPGITRKQLNEQLRDQGLFFPIDPGADASLGGMTATRASGTNAVRYGTMKDNVLALKAVLANGEVIKTAQRAKKSAAGYDLTRLFVGSEGTLRRHHRDHAASCTASRRRSRAASARSPRSRPPATRRSPPSRPASRSPASSCSTTCRSRPATPIRSSPCRSSRCCFSSSTAPRPSVAEQSEQFGEIAREHGGGPFDWATRPEDRTRLWQARHDAYWAGARPAPRRPGDRDRRVRADLAARRLPGRDPGRHRGEPAGRADPRPCRRRQFPPHPAGRPRRPRRGRARRRAVPAPGRARARHGGHLHGRARGRAGQDEIPRAPSTASRRSPSCGRSSGRSTRKTS